MRNEIFFKVLIALMFGVIFAAILSVLLTSNNANEKIIRSCEQNGFYYFDHERGITCLPIQKQNNP